jgi:membrane protease subunit HflK
MARGEEPVSTDERVRRGATRAALNLAAAALALAVLAAWGYTGFYQLDPGKAAVILRFGAVTRVEHEPGLRFHLPPPLELHEVVAVDTLEREEFGASDQADEHLAGPALEEAAMQTRDNNIVHLGFVVQYRISDPAAARFNVAERREVLRDAAQAAVREVVGRTSIDGVLSEGRGAVEDDTLELLQAFLDRYGAGLEVTSVQLQEVQPPGPVRGAFDDVIAAAQDRDRQIQEARGYENEVLPRARAEARELEAQAAGYREAKVAESKGEAARFLALYAEYQRAPEVTRRRLYLEAMEDVLPRVQKLIIEPGTAVLPWFPAGPAAAPPAGAAPGAPRAGRPAGDGGP